VTNVIQFLGEEKKNRGLDWSV